VRQFEGHASPLGPARHRPGPRRRCRSVVARRRAADSAHPRRAAEGGGISPTGWTFWAALSQQIEHAAPRRPSLEAGPITLEVNRGQPAEATAAPLESVTVVAELDGGVARQAFALRAEPRSNPTVLAVLNIPLVRRLEEKS